MSKDENQVSYIEEFNRSHRRIKREEKDWYVLYLPRGLGMEDITEKEDRELMAIFTQAEEEMEDEFDVIVRDRFQGYFESLSLVDILEYLPQKPVPILLENMKGEDRNAIKEIYDECISSGYIKKTIRKQIRKYLLDHGYLKQADLKEAMEAEKEAKKEKKKSEKKIPPRKDVNVADVREYLPQKPFPLELTDLESDHADHIIDLYQGGVDSGFVRKTIRKQIRRYLEEKGYFDEKRMKKLAEKSEKGAKAEEGKPSPKRKKTVKSKPGEEAKKAAKGTMKTKTVGKAKAAKKSKKVTKTKLPKEGVKKTKAVKKGEVKPSTRSRAKKVPVIGIEVPEIETYLPQKPTPVSLKALKKRDRGKVEEIISQGVASKHITKTIRKHIRTYLEEKGYFELKAPAKPSRSGKGKVKVSEKKKKAPPAKDAGKKTKATKKKTVPPVKGKGKTTKETAIKSTAKKTAPPNKKGKGAVKKESTSAGKKETKGSGKKKTSPAKLKSSTPSKKKEKKGAAADKGKGMKTADKKKGTKPSAKEKGKKAADKKKETKSSGKGKGKKAADKKK